MCVCVCVCVCVCARVCVCACVHVHMYIVQSFVDCCIWTMRNHHNNNCSAVSVSYKTEHYKWKKLPLVLVCPVLPCYASNKNQKHFKWWNHSNDV